MRIAYCVLRIWEALRNTLYGIRTPAISASTHLKHTQIIQFLSRIKPLDDIERFKL